VCVCEYMRGRTDLLSGRYRVAACDGRCELAGGGVRDDGGDGCEVERLVKRNS
jgi:hypothetical protein